MKSKFFALFFLIGILICSTACAAPKMLGIEGSDVASILKACSDLGIEEPQSTAIENGFSWHSEFFTINKVQVCYDIIANEDNAINEASFTMIDGDNGLFYFATFIFSDENAREDAWEFIKENYGSNADTTINDADVHLGVLGNMYTLRISVAQ